MSHENNNERDERLRNIPAPRFRRDPEFERMDFEDRALDSSLKTMAKSRDDGNEFLLRVKSRLDCDTIEASSDTEKATPSFFGVAVTSLNNIAAAPSVEAPQVETKPSMMKAHYVTVAIATVASLLVGLVVWKPVFNSDLTDETQFHIASATEKSPSGRDPALAPRDAIKTEVADHETEKVANEVPATEIEAAVVPPEIASAPSPLRVEATEATGVKPLWHLRFNFDESGTATAWIGNEKLQSEIPGKNANVALKCICHEVAKHVHFYSPILKPQWQGKLTVSGPDFQLEEPFNGIDEMFHAGMQIRSSLQKHVGKSDGEPATKELNFNHFSNLHTRHERLVTRALVVTDSIVKRELDPSVFTTPKSVLYRNFSHLSEFDLSAKSTDNAFVEREIGGPHFQNLDGIQNRNTAQLKQELKRTSQFDLFDDAEESIKWTNDVINATERHRPFVANRRLTEQRVELERSRKQAINRFYGRRIEKEIKKLDTKLSLTSVKMAAAGNLLERDGPLISLLPQKPELNGFELAMGDACNLCESDAATLDEVSNQFGVLLGHFDGFGSRNPNRKNRQRISLLSWMVRSIAFHDNPDQAIGTIDQMLQVEQSDIRLELVKTLGRLDSAVACRLLACYAKYDVEAEVRTAATDALRSYPPVMCRAELLEGFSYPWPDAAKHSAEALIRLNDTDSVPALVELLEKPDPRLPTKQNNGAFVHREMVAINHLRNCMLCHLDSHDPIDKGRGTVPTWGKPLPRRYYADNNPEFARVRADVTYLRQDFSLVQKVPKRERGRWPVHQRFDYVVRNKTISFQEADKITRKIWSRPNEYQEAIVTALQRLTGKSLPSNSRALWNAAVKEL